MIPSTPAFPAGVSRFPPAATAAGGFIGGSSRGTGFLMRG
jgi:hypothetical protein